MKRLATGLVLLLAATVAAIVVVWAPVTTRAPAADVAGLNDIAATAGEQWPNLVADPYPRAARFTIVDASGEVVLDHGAELTSPLEAAAARAITMPVESGGQRVAEVYCLDPFVADFADRQRAVAWTATVGLGVIALIAAISLVVTYRRIVRPFERLEAFAADVAGGRLDAPLAMDRSNAFGAWTESFDLMRSELAAARSREEEAVRFRRELIAQLSHDIRTPVATIAATAELLRLRSRDEETTELLRTLSAKTTQIESLMADLGEANEVAVPTLPVTLVDLPSDDLADLIRQSDARRDCRISPLPDCLVRIDPRRMQQVLDNVVGNAVKYAGTTIAVTGALDGDFLILTLADSGPGLPADELPTIFARGTRGSNAGEIPGSGLGLHTSAYLMERMGGSISARIDGGFVVHLTIPLA